MMTSKEAQAKKYSLFLDESGGFVEAKSRGKEPPAGVIISSQEVGFLAPYRDDIRDVARQIMRTILEDSKLNPGRGIHGRDLSTGMLNKLVERLIPYFKEYNWQPVRIVNLEGVSYGTNREANQTNIVAELVLRLFEMKASHPTDEIEIYLMHDAIRIAGDGGRRTYMSQKAILRPIDEYLAFASNRRGIASKQAKWQLRVSQLFGDAQTLPELQICDLICTITKNDFEKCYPSLRPKLDELFGDYDQTMKSYDLLREVDELTGFKSYGLAIRALAEFVYLVEGGSDSTANQNRLDHILDQLVFVGKRARDSQLAFLVAWLDQVIGSQRLAAAGYDIAMWIQDRVIVPLRRRLGKNQEESINWFDFAVGRWSLTAANHRGAVAQGKKAIEHLRFLQPSLAKRSEHIPLLMEGIVTQAVHEMDTFNFTNSLNQLQWVADALAYQSTSIAKLMPEVISTSPRYELRARALGTLTSALILRGFRDEDDFAYARLVSDDAIAEFVDLDDRARQYQLRSHLESNFGEFGEARKYLLRSINFHDEVTDGTHSQLAQRISEAKQDTGFSFQFTLAHWLRIGANACLKGDKEEASLFYESFSRSNVANTSWSRGENTEYPAHIILRFLAVNQAYNGETINAMKTLKRLQANTDSTFSLILGAIQIAAFAEVAGLLWPSEESASLVGLAASRYEYEPTFGIKAQLDIQSRTELQCFPFLKETFSDWHGRIDLLFANHTESLNSRDLLLGIGKAVPY